MGWGGRVEKFLRSYRHRRRRDYVYMICYERLFLWAMMHWGGACCEMTGGQGGLYCV